MGPLMHRRHRMQLQAGHMLLALAIFMALPIAKPGLWPLEIWGEFNVPVFVWPTIFLGVSFMLLRTRRTQVAMLGMMGAAWLMVAVSVAAYLSLGWNALTLIAGVKALHCVWTAIDLKTLSRGRNGTA